MNINSLHYSLIRPFRLKFTQKVSVSIQGTNLKPPFVPSSHNVLHRIPHPREREFGQPPTRGERCVLNALTIQQFLHVGSLRRYRKAGNFGLWNTCRRKLLWNFLFHFKEGCDKPSWTTTREGGGNRFMQHHCWEGDRQNRAYKEMELGVAWWLSVRPSTLRGVVVISRSIDNECLGFILFCIICDLFIARTAKYVLTRWINQDYSGQIKIWSAEQYI